MKVDGRSRLPDVEGCVKGYLHISPFMNQTRYDNLIVTLILRYLTELNLSSFGMIT